MSDPIIRKDIAAAVGFFMLLLPFLVVGLIVVVEGFGALPIIIGAWFMIAGGLLLWGSRR